jgi:hypothetical protein
MTHSSRIDWCALLSVAAAIGAILLGASYWIGGPVLLVLLLCAYPQSYETTVRGLMVRDALTRRLFPYATITLVTPASRGRLRIQCGLASEIILAPVDPESFVADLAARTPHLTRRGRELVLRDRYVEYQMRDLDYIPG